MVHLGRYNTIDWVAYKKDITSHISRGWEVQDHSPAWSGEGPSWFTAGSFSPPCPHIVQGEGIPLETFYKGTITFVSAVYLPKNLPQPPAPNSHLWRLGFQ